MNYLLGDNETALRRLRIVADVFASSTRIFLTEAADRLRPARSSPNSAGPETVLDLGCGPGFTTSLLAAAFPGRRVIGLDGSTSFLGFARETRGTGIYFRKHDVTTTPLPGSPTAAIYCRYLLTHLPEPTALISKWMSQLSPGGLLLLEEVEWIRTRDEALGVYLNMLSSALEHQGGELFIGKILGDWAGASEPAPASNRVQPLSVPLADAANMFQLNLATLRKQPFYVDNFSREEIDGLQEELGRMAGLTAGDSGEAVVEWGLRQIALQTPVP